MKYIVYITTNNKNNKVYIGVHKTEDPNKFDGYLGNGVMINMPSTYMKPKTAFQAAVKKYGVASFSRKILYVYDNPEAAYNKESELVTHEFIMSEHNYNMIPGGGDDRPTDPIYQFDCEGNLVKNWGTMEEAREFFNCSLHAFKTALHFKEKLFGYFWSRKEKINVEEFSKGDPKKPVYKYTKEGKLIEQFDSLLDCSKKENRLPSSIVTAIQGNSLVGKQFYYSFTLYDIYIPKAKASLKDSKFYIYDLQGNYLKEIPNIKQLLEFIGNKSYASAWDAINRRNGLYKEYQIKLEYKDKISPINNKSKSKKVDVYDKEGNFIKTCDSVAKAAKEFGAKASSINRVLRGLANTTAGYVFKFNKES